MTIELPNTGAIGFINQTMDVTPLDVSFDFPPGGIPPSTPKHDQLANRDLPDQHPISAITGLQVFIDSMVFKTINGESILGTGNIVIAGGGGGGTSDHPSLTNRDIADQHPIGAITGLQAALDSKAPSSHTHDISAVSGLQAALDALASGVAGSAAIIHGHVIGDVSGLQTALNGKAALSHGHVIADVSGLQTELDGKALSSHGHAIANVSGLQTALDGKAASSHGHAIADVSGLQAALDAKATPSDISTALTGYVKIHIGTTPPSDTSILWLDTN